jgi:hypothetical protein
MVVRPLASMALLAALLLPGCLVDEVVSQGGIPEGEPASGPNAGSRGDHGEPERSETGVSVDREGLLGTTGRYVASKTITVTNDFGGASRADVELATGAGGVTARGWSEGGYKVVVVLEARAGSEAEARSWLAKLSYLHGDDLDGDELRLSSIVRFPDGGSNGVSLSGQVTASLPQEPSYALELDAGSGGATTAGLSGSVVEADTGSGGVSIDGRFARMVADTGSGGVELAGTANSVEAGTGSGGIAARLATGAGGSWTFSAGSGGIDVEVVRNNGAGLEVVADAGSGTVEVDVTDGRDVGEQSDDHAHVRSAGFDDAPFRISLRASTGSGGIDVVG